jgi:YidC/Oxa1 family membrane protein insertase
MEKRALVAFVLSLVVLFFWEYYFGLVKGPETPPGQESTQSSPAPPAPSPKGAPSPSLQSIAPRELPTERLTQLEKQYQSWTVESSLYKMQLLAPGARINSFQLEKYREHVEPNSPPMNLVPTRLTGYLPLAVDLLHHGDWQLATRNFRSDAPPLVNLSPEMQAKELSLTTEVPGNVRLTKTFTLVPDTYMMDVEIVLQNLSQDQLADQLGVSFYFQPYSDAATESSYNKSQLSSYANNGLTSHSAKELSKEITLKAPIDWMGYENNYFLQAIIPLEDSGYQVIPRILDQEKQLMQVVYLTDPFQVGPNEEKHFKLRVYMGPKELNQLQKAEHNLAKAIDYGWFTILAKPLMLILQGFYKFTHNYGVAIILLTVLIKLFFWPLTHKSYKSMQSMKKLQPKIAQVREKYKDDKEKLNQELMDLYRTYKVNPLGGCLPMVLQIPVFFALYRMLNAAVELRHQPFFLWINDLTAPDRLYIGFDIPYLGGLPVLTIFMGVSMFVQQKMTPSGGDPRQEQIMLLMPVIFTVMFINFPSGLVLYWLVNNVLSIVQQYWVNKSA